ncbi:MAG: GGDEF domain-containing protein [Pseudomonadota bacterium]
MNTELQNTLTNCKTLPSLPTVAAEIIQLTSQDDFGLNDLTDIVRNDMAIATKLIATANTVAYRGNEAVTEISNAVARLGFKSTVMIALSFSLAVRGEQTKTDSVDTAALWQRSVASAAIARILARQMESVNAEACFLAGLVQDIGVLAMLQAAPETYANLEDASHDDARDAEIQMHGCDHAEVGVWLLNSWKFPSSVVDLIGSSHSFAELTLEATGREEHWCVAASGLLVDAMLEGDQLQAARMVSLIEGVCSLRLDDYADIVKPIAEAVREAEALFDTSLVKDPLLLLEASKLRLLEMMSEGNLDAGQDRIAKLEKRVSALEQQGQLDVLTGVINRRHFHQEFDRLFTLAQTRNEPFSLMFIDADRFKRINDTHGHLAGDEVLTWLATSLQDLVNDHGIVGRYGGEEFVVIVPGKPERDAKVLGDRICEQIRNSSVSVSGVELKVTVSIGVSAADPASRVASTRELIFAADQAMYFAKQSGRDLCIAASSLPPLQFPGAAPPA